MREWIVTFFGAGKFPIAPGTFGSFAAGMVVLLLHALCEKLGAPPIVFQLSLIGLILLTAAATVQLGPWALQHFGRKDPGPFVLDEVAGIGLTMLLLPDLAGRREIVVVILAFIAFRIFDIWKPPPCHRLERLPAGWGILMDDLMAAVYANLLVQIVLRYHLMGINS